MNYKERYKSLKEELSKMEDKTSNLALLLTDSMHDLEKLHPELKESEEDRIRKKVIDVLKLNVRGAETQMQANRGTDRTFEVYACNKVIAWLEKQGEHTDIPAEWSEEDERDFDVINGIIYNSCNAEDASRLIEWLKSLKDRVQSQPKQEWSNWDKTIIESIEALCDEKIESTVFQDVKEHVNDIKDWLKSLRPQNTWKPSDKQIYSLDRALRFYGKGTAVYDSVKELLEQLKKLREE